jgi:hypothetical protein
VVSLFFDRRRAGLVRDAVGRTAQLARPLAPAVEERLGQLPDANVVVYGAGRADLPFVGSGRRIRDWNFQVDLTRGAPVSFTTAEVHEHLDASFIGEMTDSLVCLHRLYVDGRSFRPVLSPPAHPLQYIGHDAVLTEVAAEDGGFRRVYFCLQQTARKGELVVSLFVRPRLDAGVLHLEIALHALLPLRSSIIRPVAQLGRHPLDILARSISIGSRLLLGRFRRDLQGPFEYGATTTLRERISVDDLGEVRDDAVLEVFTIGASLQDRLAGALREFLVEHHVDTTEFDQTTQSIVADVEAGITGLDASRSGPASRS